MAPVLRAARFEADQAAQLLATLGVEVVPLVAVHGAQVSWGKLVVDGVPVVTARRPDRPRTGPVPRRRLNDLEDLQWVSRRQLHHAGGPHLLSTTPHAHVRDCGA